MYPIILGKYEWVKEMGVEITIYGQISYKQQPVNRKGSHTPNLPSHLTQATSVYLEYITDCTTNPSIASILYVCSIYLGLNIKATTYL